MSAIILKAHFDGKHIQLDEPCDLIPNCELFVTVVTPELAAERESFFNAAAYALGQAYGENEPEYSEADFIKE